ncbi:hypothetical protein FXF51_27815 [Nonomuraea sp. PA05]|uniref:hypothetical protein n=1 Tax=Nonomuraea sp. PA05 TaxID=2604466 RepID=UPI0011DBABFC|nr:hypothetical protein [Nonomuraea sp. PA05]TYB61873.1 hypothetical protein FXF51_27815 [Nonomuraea sp. PA05]
MAPKTRQPRATAPATGEIKAGGIKAGGIRAGAVKEAKAAPGLTFHEKMSGYFAMGVKDPREGARIGHRTGWRLTLRATVTIPDLKAFTADPAHPGTLRGEIELPGVERRIPFHDGIFHLFAPSGTPDLTLLLYEASFSHQGQAHYLAGRKSVRDDLGLDLWPDTTTLDVRLHRGPDTRGEVTGAGVLRLGAGDLAALLLSMRARNVASPVEAARVFGAFGLLFARNLRDSYLLRPRAYLRRRERS